MLRLIGVKTSSQETAHSGYREPAPTFDLCGLEWSLPEGEMGGGRGHRRISHEQHQSWSEEESTRGQTGRHGRDQGRLGTNPKEFAGGPGVGEEVTAFLEQQM